MAKTVVGLFDDPAAAQNVVQDLVDSGFSRGDIGVIANNTDNQYSTGTVAGDAGYHHAGEDVVKGAETGAVLGGIAGLLIGFGAFAIPGVGPIVAAGPIAAALTGAGMGAVAGGLLGALTNLGVPDDEARYYAEGVRRGGTLVTVKTDDGGAGRAAEIFHRRDAVDIDARKTHYRETGFTGGDPSAWPAASENETMGMDRRPVNRPIGAIENTAFQASVIELTETAEEAVVAKQARVVEEVAIHKTATDRTETVRDTVRRQDVEIEELNGGATLAEDERLPRPAGGGAFNR